MQKKIYTNFWSYPFLSFILWKSNRAKYDGNEPNIFIRWRRDLFNGIKIKLRWKTKITFGRLKMVYWEGIFKKRIFWNLKLLIFGKFSTKCCLCSIGVARGGRIRGTVPPEPGKERENSLKNARKCIKFWKFFACGAYWHRRHHSFSIIKPKFFYF